MVGQRPTKCIHADRVRAPGQNSPNTVRSAANGRSTPDAGRMSGRRLRVDARTSLLVTASAGGRPCPIELTPPAGCSRIAEWSTRGFGCAYRGFDPFPLGGSVAAAEADAPACGCGGPFRLLPVPAALRSWARLCEPASVRAGPERGRPRRAAAASWRGCTPDRRTCADLSRSTTAARRPAVGRRATATVSRTRARSRRVSFPMAEAIRRPATAVRAKASPWACRRPSRCAWRASRTRCRARTCRFRCHVSRPGRAAASSEAMCAHRPTNVPRSRLTLHG